MNELTLLPSAGLCEGVRPAEPWSARLNRPSQSAIDSNTLLEQIKKREARIGVIGLGYVGLPLSLAACKAGFRVLGFDTNHERVEGLNAGKSPLQHIGEAKVAAALREDRFNATSDFRQLSDVNALLICVPTPLGPHREPDLSFVEATSRNIADHLQPGQLVVLESTTYPGTTREVVKPILETSGLRSGTDFFLAYSPEREDPGNLDFDTSRIPKIIAGDGETALALASALYQQFVVSIVPVSSPETAEAVKLTENIFRAVNIALVNELKVVFAAIGVDIFEVVDAAKTKPFGYMPFYPGPGLGGHCIPIDPFYLTWKARELGISTRFIELAGEINTNMPRYVVERLREELDCRLGQGLFGSRILIVGVAYKKNVDDMRESPAITIMKYLDQLGAKVDYYDPYFPVIPPTRQYAELAGKASIAFEGYLLARYHAAVIVTDHDSVDYATLLRFSKVVLDTRNAMARVAGGEFAHVVAKA
jgi:UDP-N-acetyl-D-glucosamine dehydrogenase